MPNIWAFLVAIAIATWGQAPDVPVRVTEYNDPVRVWAWSDTYPTECVITMATRMTETLDARQLQNLMTHEVGHCLGVPHLAAPGVMNAPTFFDFSEFDIAALWQVRRAPFRLSVAFVASD